MSGGEQTVRVGGRLLRVTNLDKVLYPETGTTKGEVIDYYTRIGGVLLPHVSGRPVTRKRWPDGVGTAPQPGPSFFAKALPASAPSWIPRRRIDHSTGAKDYPLVEEVPTLVYLAQTASLELHVPQWRFNAHGGRAPSDRLVLDLDPGEGAGLAECAEVARWARDILSGVGMTALPVTSGSTGIHLYAGLPEPQPADAVSAFARELARAIEADHGDLVVSRMSKAARAGRVLIDWSQNNAAKTTIAPYSLRGRPHPTVAAPRTWSELDDPHLRQLLLTEVIERVTSDGDPLTSYLAKRSAAHTPEPMPAEARRAAASEGLPRFVIHEHHASHLHWDLRLEHDGVLISWAVPKGVPSTSARDSLAVMTEAHPLDYADFAGTIPSGHYGAGTMTIWDGGRYEAEKWRDDEVIFTLVGRAGGPLGRTRFALIRTDGAGEKSTWLLHRMKTDAAGHRQPGGTPPPAEAAPAAPPAPSMRPMLATAATPALAREAAERWGVAWAEAKWDGMRAIGFWDGARLHLRARSGNDLTRVYPELTATDLALGTATAVLDGEIVALDARGRPSFSRLQRRMSLHRSHEIAREATRTPVTLYLFDILAADGHDLTPLPLARRRVALEAVTAHAHGPIVVPPVFDDVDAALATSVRLGLEGVVVKDPRSPYRRGERSDRWLKVALTLTREVVIGGIRPGRGARTGMIGSLLVGVPDGDGLRYAGRVGSGFTDAALTRLAAVLAPRRSDENPFVGVPAADAADALWLRPELVGEVTFAELTTGGILRQARWRGLRPDKSPAEVSPGAP